jgi:hypothetical protein
MNIKVTNEQELLKITEEAIHIITNLRHFTKKWNEGHGYELRQRKAYYEEQADKLIQRLQITEHRRANQIKIEVNGTE